MTTVCLNCCRRKLVHRL